MTQPTLFEMDHVARVPRRRSVRARADTVTVGSLCTGYGGLEMALALAGVPVELAWVADNDPAASKLLALRYPGVANLGDVKRIDWASQARVTILTAGYPCQPFSHAGQRKGTDDPRHIWPYILHGIRILRPPYVFLENVPGHRSRGFGTVIGDLATLGYVGSWISLRASDVGAAHRRERVFILAWPADTARPRLETGRQGWSGERADALTLLPTPHANCSTGAGTSGRDGGLNLQTAIALLPTPTSANSHGNGVNNRDLALPAVAHRLLPTPMAADGGANRGSSAGNGLRNTSREIPHDWGIYGPAVERWEAILGRPAPSPTEPGRDSRPRLSPRFVEWLMGLPIGWVTDAPELKRNDQLRLLGNGVVRQQGAAAFTLLYARAGVAR